VQAESHGIGSKIEVEAGGKKMIREIDGGGSSHISQNSVIAHFGLGNAAKIDRVTVYWTGGNTQTITNIAVNQLITITEIPVKKSNSVFVYLALALGSAVVLFIFLKKKKIV
jgi:hypothetical protein